jgi:hypothetical protein
MPISSLLDVTETAQVYPIGRRVSAEVEGKDKEAQQNFEPPRAPRSPRKSKIKIRFTTFLNVFDFRFSW